MTIKKGFSYLGSNKHQQWFIIQQVSMKQWVAMCFTHTLNYVIGEFPSFTFNSIDMSNQEWIELHEFKVGDKVAFRQAMFSILKYGEIR
jgi:hypothetical protein